VVHFLSSLAAANLCLGCSARLRALPHGPARRGWERGESEERMRSVTALVAGVAMLSAVIVADRTEADTATWADVEAWIIADAAEYGVRDRKSVV